MIGSEWPRRVVSWSTIRSSSLRWKRIRPRKSRPSRSSTRAWICSPVWSTPTCGSARRTWSDSRVVKSATKEVSESREIEAGWPAIISRLGVATRRQASGRSKGEAASSGPRSRIRSRRNWPLRWTVAGSGCSGTIDGSGTVGARPRSSSAQRSWPGASGSPARSAAPQEPAARGSSASRSFGSGCIPATTAPRRGGSPRAPGTVGKGMRGRLKPRAAPRGSGDRRKPGSDID